MNKNNQLLDSSTTNSCGLTEQNQQIWIVYQ